MNIDLSLIRGIIRKSLEESASEELPNDVRRTRAIFHALKAMCIVCKDQPLSQNVSVHNAPSPELERTVKIMMEPDVVAAVRLLPDMVQKEMEAAS